MLEKPNSNKGENIYFLISKFLSKSFVYTQHRTPVRLTTETDDQTLNLEQEETVNYNR